MLVSFVVQCLFFPPAKCLFSPAKPATMFFLLPEGFKGPCGPCDSLGACGRQRRLFLTLILWSPVVNTCCQKMAVHLAATELVPAVACGCEDCGLLFLCTFEHVGSMFYKTAKAHVKCCEVSHYLKEDSTWFVMKMFPYFLEMGWKGTEAECMPGCHFHRPGVLCSSRGRSVLCWILPPVGSQTRQASRASLAWSSETGD